MDKKVTIICQPHIDSLITKQKSRSKKDEQLWNDKKIKEILSAGSSLTKGVIKNS